jgi:hypothetical protein
MNDNQTWIAMFQRLPTRLHESLAVTMSSGAEILIQRLIRMEADFLILRGRLAGTQENRVMLLPYAQMAVISIVSPLKDAEVEAIFGGGGTLSEVAMPAPVEQETPAEAPQEPAAEPVRKPAAPTKSALVAKLRERLKGEPRTQ